MNLRSPQRSAWLSYYASLDHNPGLFLSGYLAPLVQEETRAGRLKRFFFIRYTEETLQLRMRFLPTHSEWASRIEARVAEAVHDFNSSFAQERAALLKQVPYDRSLYFGETMRSVYSELLNERTSHFALRLLRLYSHQQTQLFVVLTSVLHCILSQIAPPCNGMSALAEESIEFAAKAIANLKLPPCTIDPDRAKAISSSLLSVSGNARRALQADPDLCIVVQLLQRVEKVAGGNFVRIHSLHLLANKLGFTLADECLMFTLLKEMASRMPAIDGGTHDKLE